MDKIKCGAERLLSSALRQGELGWINYTTTHEPHRLLAERSNGPDFRCFCFVSWKSPRVQRHNESHVLSAEGEELGTDDCRAEALREVAKDPQVHRVLSHLNGIHEDNADEICYANRMD